MYTFLRKSLYYVVLDLHFSHSNLISSTVLTCGILTQLWTPPTPPQDDNDIYIDSVMMLMYDATPMPESKLPPIYIRKEHKRLKMDPSGKMR